MEVLIRATCPTDPLELFDVWLKHAIDGEINEAYAMTLITSDTSGQPHGRVVYLRDIMEGQLVFYTNYNSHKGNELTENNKVALLFFWPELKRQVSD